MPFEKFIYLLPIDVVGNLVIYFLSILLIPFIYLFYLHRVLDSRNLFIYFQLIWLNSIHLFIFVWKTREHDLFIYFCLGRLE